jgi:hypothetical protein
MEKSRLAGNVVAPALETSASTEQRTPTSRSVVVRLTEPLLAWTKTLDKMGKVVRVLTIF